MDTHEKPVNYLIVDSSVLIRRAPLKDLAEKVYAVSAVVSEIKDANTRASLQVLPYEFHFKEPSSEATKFVGQFARKTGDYQNLSAVDLHLIALTYQMCKENMSDEEFALLKSEPPKNHQPVINASNIKLDKQVNVAGFYLPKKNLKKEENEEAKSDVQSNAVENLSEDLGNKLGLAEQDENNNSLNEADLNDSQLDGESDDEGWITPGNLEQIKKLSQVESDQKTIEESSQVKVGCMTSDFSMQNVLIQIGIPVLSVDGLLIKKPRSYVLRCITCAKITTNMSKQFCPNCGYKSLERVVVTVDENGNKVYRGRRKPVSTKGLRYSLPTPRGGKHSNYPILSEDQPRAQQLPSKKSQVRNDPLDPDYASFNSPFTTKDVYSRAARLGINNRNSGRR